MLANVNLLQLSGLGILLLAGMQALLWMARLIQMRISLVRERSAADHNFLGRLSQIQSRSITTPVARAWQGERLFTVRSKRALNSDTCELELIPVDEDELASFLPGQHLFLSHKDKNGQRLLRCYSIINSPLDNACYRIAVRRIPAPESDQKLPAGGMSSYVHQEIQAGDTLKLKAPSGHFYLVPEVLHETALVFVAIDIGILAVLSIIQYVRSTQPERRISVFYGAASKEKALYLDQLQAMATAEDSNLKLTLSLGHNIKPSQPEQEPLTLFLAGFAEQLGELDYYLAGYTSDVNAAMQLMRTAGVPAYAIRSETYKIRRGGERRQLRRRRSDLNIASAEQTKGAKTGRGLPKVSFLRSDCSMAWVPTSASLLDFAEHNSVDIPSDCRMGSCHTCMTRVVQGEVEYVQPPFNEPDQGHCLPCISIPKTDVELEV